MKSLEHHSQVSLTFNQFHCQHLAQQAAVVFALKEATLMSLAGDELTMVHFLNFWCKFQSRSLATTFALLTGEFLQLLQECSAHSSRKEETVATVRSHIFFLVSNHFLSIFKILQATQDPLSSAMEFKSESSASGRACAGMDRDQLFMWM